MEQLLIGKIIKRVILFNKLLYDFYTISIMVTIDCENQLYIYIYKC
jgi:hypothetical protein